MPNVLTLKKSVPGRVTAAHQPPTASTYAGTEPTTKQVEPARNDHATEVFRSTGRTRTRT
jgi:hypothetical protein